MLGRGLIKRVAAVAGVAAAVFVAVIALGATIYFALALVTPPLAAAAITMALFALAAIIIALVFLRQAEGDAAEEEEPEGLGARAYQLFRQRPILGTAAALAGGWIFLRNPALATMVAAAFTERSHSTGRGRSRR